jgi:hypothetical protein
MFDLIADHLKPINRSAADYVRTYLDEHDGIGPHR